MHNINYLGLTVPKCFTRLHIIITRTQVQSSCTYTASRNLSFTYRTTVHCKCQQTAVSWSSIWLISHVHHSILFRRPAFFCLILNTFLFHKFFPS